MGISFNSDGQDIPLIVTEEFNLFDWAGTAYIGTPALINTGLQLSDEKTIAAGGGTAQVFGAVVNLPKSRTLISVELGLSHQHKSSAATENKWYQWKARNKDGTWVVLHGTVSGVLATGYTGTVQAGIITAQTNFDSVPFEIGLFAVSSATETYVAQVKNSSYVICKYRR